MAHVTLHCAIEKVAIFGCQRNLHPSHDRYDFLSTLQSCFVFKLVEWLRFLHSTQDPVHIAAV